MVAEDAGPILFLNPAVLLDVIGAVASNGMAIYGLRNAAPLNNGNADRLNQVVREIGACIVLTDLRQMGDVRTRLHRQGLRAAFHPSFATDAALSGGSGGVAEWLTVHGSPPYLVVDRPTGIDDPAWIEVGIGAEVSAAALDAALAALTAD